MTDYSRASCARADVDPDIFFTLSVDDRPDLTKNQVQTENTRRRRAAQQVCEFCPIKAACLDDHLTEEFGIWGGATAKDRRVLAAERGVAWGSGPYIDETAIARAVTGDQVSLDRDTKLELIRRLDAQGVGYREIQALARASGQLMKQALTSSDSPYGGPTIGRVA